MRLLVLLSCAALAVLLEGGGLAQDPASEDFARRQYESGLQFARDQKYLEALKDFQAVVERYPASRVAPAALLQIAQYHFDVASDAAAARADVDALLQKYPMSESAPLAHVMAGRITLAQSRAPASVEAALASFDRVSRLFPGSDGVPAALVYAGDALRAAGRLEDALQRYREASGGYPQSPWAARAWIGESICLARADGTRRAMEALQQVRQRFPGSPDANAALGLNTILYRLYLRPPAQPPFQFAGKTVVGPGGRLKDVEAVAFAPDGTFFVVGRNGVIAFDASGRVVSAPAAAAPTAIAFDTRGRLFVAQRGGVMLPGGKFLALGVPKPDGTRRSLDEIPGLAVNASGEISAIDKDGKAVARFSADGKHLSSINTGAAERLAVDADDTIAVLVRAGPAVVLMNPDGKVLRRVPAKAPGYSIEDPSDIAFDPFGHLYVLDRGRGSVFVFSGAGRLVTTFTVPERSPAPLRKPTSFALDPAGRLFIFDDDAQKVQVYR
jgi:TolA-binding protein